MQKINLSPSTVSTLWKNKRFVSALESNLTTNKNMRKCDLGNVDQALLEWFKVQRNAGFPINGPILKVQAEKLAKQLGHENFTCNNDGLIVLKIGITLFMQKSVERPYQ
jgi:hypothetical protein